MRVSQRKRLHFICANDSILRFLKAAVAWRWLPVRKTQTTQKGEVFMRRGLVFQGTGAHLFIQCHLFSSRPTCVSMYLNIWWVKGSSLWGWWWWWWHQRIAAFCTAIYHNEYAYQVVFYFVFGHGAILSFQLPDKLLNSFGFGFGFGFGWCSRFGFGTSLYAWLMWRCRSILRQRVITDHDLWPADPAPPK